MAARGLVPAAPHEMTMMLFQLSLDEDQSIADTARKTLNASPVELVVAAAAADIDSRVLNFIAEERGSSEIVLERIFGNPNTSDDTFAEHAESCSESISELIGANEVRVLRFPKIIERLYMNPNARMSTLDRLIDLGSRHGVEFELSALQSMLADPGYDTAAAAAASAEKVDSDRFFMEFLEAALDDDADYDYDYDYDDDDGLDDRDDQSIDPEDDDGPMTSTVANRILQMTVSEKMRLAMLGSAAERDFLVRDANRIVHMAAITSPKIMLKDIKAWSGNRIIPDGVLGYIANHRRYRRVYDIAVNLVNNPKTPMRDALRLLPQLVVKDIQLVIKNRNVSHHLRRQARSVLDYRTRKRRK